MKKVIGFFFVLSLTLSAQDASEFRQWKDTRGNVIEAKLLKDNGNGTINIQKSDGWRGDVPLNLLSAEDQEYVKSAGLATSEGPAKPVQSKDFEVSRIRREYVPGFISTKNGWEFRIKCVKVDLRYKGDRPADGAFVKAYFYDREGKEIERFGNPPRRQDETGKYVNAIERFEPGEKYEVFFPISKAVEERDWKTVLVTFGNDSEVGALSDPGSDFMAFDFNEKKILFPGWEETAGNKDAPGSPAGGSEMAASSLNPEIRSVKRDKTMFVTMVDGKWKDKHDSLMTEIRVKGGLPSKISISAYFFNSAKSIVATRARPAMTHLGQGVYSGVPSIAEENEWYPVFFPIDAELEKLKWEWAAVVFIADERAVVDVYGPGGSALTDLKFPGSDKLVAKEEPK